MRNCHIFLIGCHYTIHDQLSTKLWESRHYIYIGTIRGLGDVLISGFWWITHSTFKLNSGNTFIYNNISMHNGLKINRNLHDQQNSYIKIMTLTHVCAGNREVVHLLFIISPHIIWVGVATRIIITINSTMNVNMIFKEYLCPMVLIGYHNLLSSLSLWTLISALEVR